MRRGRPTRLRMAVPHTPLRVTGYSRIMLTFADYKSSRTVLQGRDTEHPQATRGCQAGRSGQVLGMTGSLPHFNKEVAPMTQPNMLHSY